MWETLSIFLNFLILNLPAPKEDDLSNGGAGDHRHGKLQGEAKAALKMAMADADADATVEPVPPCGGGGKGEADIDKLSAIIKSVNDPFGNVDWKDEDNIRKLLAEEIQARVAQDKALNRVVLELRSDHTELFKQFSDNPNFKC